MFCLQDGASLVTLGNSGSSHPSDATLVLPESGANLNPQAPTEISDSGAAQTLHLPPSAATVVHERARHTVHDAHVAAAPPQKTSNPWLIAGVTAIIVLLLALVGIGAALLFRDPVNAPDKEQTDGASNTSDQANANSSPAANVNNRNIALPSPEYSPPPPTSLRTTASASSTRVPMKSFTYSPAHLLDGSIQTAWIEGVPGPGIGEWIRCDFDREVKLNRINFTPGYFKNASIWKQNNRLSAATIHFSDGSSRRFTFPDLMQQQRLDVGGVRTSYVRLVIESIYPGSVDSEDTAISQMSFDWEP